MWTYFQPETQEEAEVSLHHPTPARVLLVSTRVPPVYNSVHNSKYSW